MPSDVSEPKGRLTLEFLGANPKKNWVVVSGFKHVLFSSLITWGFMIQFDLRIFLQMGWFNHQLENHAQNQNT